MTVACENDAWRIVHHHNLNSFRVHLAMAQGDFSSLRKQAQYIDEVISDLDSKLANPGRIFRPSKVPHTEKILNDIMAENEGILVNIFFHIKVNESLGSEFRTIYETGTCHNVHVTWLVGYSDKD
jgi:hypothetical protein